MICVHQLPIQQTKVLFLPTQTDSASQSFTTTSPIILYWGALNYGRKPVVTNLKSEVNGDHGSIRLLPGQSVIGFIETSVKNDVTTLTINCSGVKNCNAMGFLSRDPKLWAF